MHRAPWAYTTHTIRLAWWYRAALQQSHPWGFALDQPVRQATALACEESVELNPDLWSLAATQAKHTAVSDWGTGTGPSYATAKFCDDSMTKDVEA